MNFLRLIHWRPEIGDPSLMGWLTVLAYGLAAFTCWLAAVRTGRAAGTAKGSRVLWNICALFMAFLCLNKQLDLQSLFTEIGRVISWRQGWYENRRVYQKAFILTLLAFSFLAFAFVMIRYRAFWKRHLLLACGLAFLATFIAIRAVSFHHFDSFLKSGIGGVRMNWILELSGIGLVWLAAIFDYAVPLGLYRKRLVSRF